MSHTSILNELMDAVLDHLEDRLIDDVTDHTPVGLVRIGRLQSDPTIAELNIMIRNGGEDWRHKRPNDEHHALEHMHHPYGELGGRAAQFWLRRFEIELSLFFVGETDQAAATRSANLILSRAQHALLGMPIPDITDDFGERPLLVDVEDAYLEESGGPGNYIHRGYLRIEFLTEIAI